MASLLVVGGAGYIGSHFVLYALEKGKQVVVLDDLSSGSESALVGGTFYQGDMADRSLLKKIFSEHSIEAVLHFAAHIEVGESVSNPFKYYNNNVSKTLVLLDEMVKAQVEYFVFSSTAAVFGEPHYVPMDINHPKEPLCPYGMSKLMVEYILKDFSQAHGLLYTSLRYYNAASADPNGRIGFHEPSTHLIPNVLKVASGRKPYIEIYGTDYDTPDGTCLRDYIHVMDLASAHLLALEHMTKTRSSALYNLGNGRGISVKEIIDSVKRITGKELEVKEGPRRPGDPARLIADPSVANEVLGWTPTYSLDKIIEHAYAWEVNHKWE